MNKKTKNTKEAYYFPHFCNSRHDRKIRRVRKELGIEGYGIFFMLLEVLREQGDLKYPLEDIDLLAEELGTSEAKVKAVIFNYKLFSYNKEYFESPKLMLYMQPYFDSSTRARLAANTRWDNERKKQLEQKTDANAEQMECESECKEKKAKEKKRKENKQTSNKNNDSDALSEESSCLLVFDNPSFFQTVDEMIKKGFAWSTNTLSRRVLKECPDLINTETAMEAIIFYWEKVQRKKCEADNWNNNGYWVTKNLVPNAGRYYLKCQKEERAEKRYRAKQQSSIVQETKEQEKKSKEFERIFQEVQKYTKEKKEKLVNSFNASNKVKNNEYLAKIELKNNEFVPINSKFDLNTFKVFLKDNLGLTNESAKRSWYE